MRIHNLYEDADGESHFRDIEVDWVEETPPSGKLSKRLPATGIVFRETTADYENSWHPAPRRQYVISLAGGISITASDGETRHIGAGEIVLVEDTTGKGHITRSSGDSPRHTIFGSDGDARHSQSRPQLDSAIRRIQRFLVRSRLSCKAHHQQSGDGSREASRRRLRLCTGSIDEYGRASFFGRQHQISLKA